MTGDVIKGKTSGDTNACMLHGLYNCDKCHSVEHLLDNINAISKDIMEDVKNKKNDNMSTGITAYSDEALEAELAKRAAYKKTLAKPTVVANPDFSILIDMCKKRIDRIADGDHGDEAEHYYYEEAMQSIFGMKIFEWINKNT